MSNIYEFTCYRVLLRQLIEQHRHIRGYQTQLAIAANCFPSHVSGIIRSRLQLTLDQAMGLAVFWHLDFYQTEYFLNLVSLDRTKSGPLKTHLQKRLDYLRNAFGGRANTVIAFSIRDSATANANE